MRILYHTTPSEPLAQLTSLAQTCGIAAELGDVNTYPTLAAALQAALAGENEGAVLDVVSLQNHCRPEELATIAPWLREHNSTVLLLLAGAAPSGNWLLEGLTGEIGLRTISLPQATVINFPEAGRAFSAELSGHQYYRPAGPAMGLAFRSTAGTQAIMQLEQTPTFISTRLGNSRIFAWSTNRIFNCLKPLAAEIEFESTVDEYVPAIIFLRAAFGDRCWHSPYIGAGLVIDDPLLKRNYGFINFPRLLASARQHAYHVTLAFIPWNHWRSRASQVRPFLAAADCFSVCAHGCDHTKREFGALDYEDLLSRNHVAYQRMEKHRQRTGLACEPLMVCPQEQFSLPALRAFAASRRFIGLVATACQPRELTTPALCGADLLLPAQDCFYGFPIFKRHYWNNMAVFAMALFLGKPAILVEHHEFFRHGPGGTEKFAAELLKLRPQLKWTSLQDTAQRTHWRRRLTTGGYEVRFFTDTFHLEHTGQATADYRMLRRVTATTTVQKVTVAGREVPFSQEEGWLSFSTRVEHPQRLTIQIEVYPIPATKVYAPGIKYHAKVALRRGLSEIRDNLIARNDTLLRLSKWLMKKLKQTSR